MRLPWAEDAIDGVNKRGNWVQNTDNGVYNSINGVQDLVTGVNNRMTWVKDPNSRVINRGNGVRHPVSGVYSFINFMVSVLIPESILANKFREQGFFHLQ